MNTQIAAYYGILLCAVISAKWAMDLGFSQSRQVIYGIAGMLFGPLTLLILYVYMLYAAEKRGKPSARWF